MYSAGRQRAAAAAAAPHRPHKPNRLNISSLPLDMMPSTAPPASPVMPPSFCMRLGWAAAGSAPAPAAGAAGWVPPGVDAAAAAAVLLALGMIKLGTLPLAKPPPRPLMKPPPVEPMLPSPPSREGRASAAGVAAGAGCAREAGAPLGSRLPALSPAAARVALVGSAWLGPLVCGQG